MIFKETSPVTERRSTPKPTALWQSGVQSLDIMPVDQIIEITSASRARRIKRRGFAAMITIEDPALRTSKRVRFHREPHPHHLVLAFEDLDAPTTAIITASPNQVAQAIEFGRLHRTGAMLIHCHAGIARSTAVALAIIADRLGAGQEQAALARLLHIQPYAVPNLLVVAHADHALGRDGLLLRTVTDWDAGLTWNQHRRDLNNRAILEYYERAGPAWSTLDKAR
jgi:predicted protein tyrosine phosphatase